MRIASIFIIDVVPHNDAIIECLKSRSYTVMNLIELRRLWPGEELLQKVMADDHEFDY
ncbi:MAG: hypothetical protein ACXAC0_07265 [Candidatus Thorarchaeota archaeon]